MNASKHALGERIDIASVREPLLMQALAAWTERKGAERFPARSEMTPRAMAPFLRNIVLARVLEGGKEYEFRIVGDAVVQIQGDSFQGLTLTQIDAKLPGYGSLLRPMYDQVIAEGVPHAWRGQMRQSFLKRSFAHETLILPLGTESVDHLLAVCAYAYTDGTTPRP